MPATLFINMSNSLGVASACLVAAAGAFVQPQRSNRPRSFVGRRVFSADVPAPSSALSVLTEDQSLHTAERLAGMSRGEIQHIFEDLDADGSGTIDVAELDLLSKVSACDLHGASSEPSTLTSFPLDSTSRGRRSRRNCGGSS